MWCTKISVIKTSTLITSWSNCVAILLGLRKLQISLLLWCFKTFFVRLFPAIIRNIFNSLITTCKFFIARNKKITTNITWNSTNWIDFCPTVVKFNFLFSRATLTSLCLWHHLLLIKVNINACQINRKTLACGWLLKNPGFCLLDSSCKFFFWSVQQSDLCRASQ